MSMKSSGSSDSPETATEEIGGPNFNPEEQPGHAVVLSSQTVYTGRVFWVTADKVTEPSGWTSERDVIRHNGSVVIFAVDASKSPANPTVAIIRQYRHAAGQFLVELPAGRIEPGEDPLAAAMRELFEETGIKAERWSPLVRYYASPGFLSETMQIFLAEGLSFEKAHPEDDESIELLRVPLVELLRWIDEGRVLDGKTVTGTLTYARRYFDLVKQPVAGIG